MNEAQFVKRFPALLEHYDEFMPFVSHWHVCASGPPPYGSMEPVILAVDGLIIGTREEALSYLGGYIASMCERWGREYVPEEWNAHVMMTGAYN